MYLEHDLGGRFTVFAEKFLNNQHHKLHGGEIVIQHENLEHLGRLDLIGDAVEHQSIAAVRRSVGLGGYCRGNRFSGCHEFDSIDPEAHSWRAVPMTLPKSATFFKYDIGFGAQA